MVFPLLLDKRGAGIDDGEGGGVAFDPVVTEYASRSGMDDSKLGQLNDLVTYLKGQGLWSSVKHLYLTTKGFNADSGATVYDVIDPVADGGDDLTQTGCTWGTDEGQGIAVPSTGSMTSSAALLSPSGSHTVLSLFRFEKLVSTSNHGLWKQGVSPNEYSYGCRYNATKTAQDLFLYPQKLIGGAVVVLDDSFRTGNWSSDFTEQGWWKNHPVAIVFNSSSGKAFAYGNHDACSMFASAAGADDGIDITPITIEDEPFIINYVSGRGQFTMEYLLVMDSAISGNQYQAICHEIEKALAPRSPAKVNSGLMWLDASGSIMYEHNAFMFYDTETSKYYRYAIKGIGYTGTPPNDTGVGTYQGIFVYSAASLVGPWTFEGLAYDKNNSTLITALGSPSLSDVAVARMSMVYHPTRQVYVLGMKAVNTDGLTNKIFVLAESSDPLGPFITSFTGQINSEDVGDNTLFRDADNTAYVVYANASTGDLKIVALNADYDGISGTPQTIVANREAPGMVKVGTRYWLICSERTGWTPGATQALYSNAANPLSGWTSIGNPFDSSDEAYELSFLSQSAAGLFLSKGGDVIYNGNINVPHYYSPYDLRNGAMRSCMLPVSIVGTAMTISWEPHWSPLSYE